MSANAIEKLTTW